MEDWWTSFTSLTSPALDAELTLAGRTDEAAALLQLLEAESRLTTIAAASVDDVLAFVGAAIMSAGDERRDDLLGRALIVRDTYALRALTLSEGLLILLPFEDDFRREARLIRSHHVVIRADEGGGADIDLPPIDAPSFAQLLRNRGENQDRADELARAARHSIVAFQRRGSTPHAAPRPGWATTLASRVTRRAWLAGRWNERRSGDMDALAALFSADYAESRDELVALAEGADPLFMVLGDTWAVVSLEDAWQHGHRRLQMPDLSAFEILIQTVLGAVDPKLDLPVGDRWMAAVYGKTRLHSSDLRKGIAEVLALLGARGPAVTIGSETIRSWLHHVLWRLFGRLNEDASGHLWASLTDVLPLLAEAAPDVFLQAVQWGLDGERPLLGAMFLDRGQSSLSVSSPHTGLLWALENVAWSAEHFSLAVEQLARLAEVDPGGRLSNRPAASLADIFRPWLPQSAVSGERRLRVLDGLRDRHSDVAWSLMLTMLPQFQAVGGYTYAPKFRDWKPDDRGLIAGDRSEIEEAVARRLLEDAGSRPDRWAELVSRFDDFPPEVLPEAVRRLEALAQSPEIAQRVWQPLQDLARKHQRYSSAAWAMNPAQLALLDGLQQQLEPVDAVARVRWLFDDHRPDLPEENATELDSSRYMEPVAARRRAAVTEVWGASSTEGLLRLAREAAYPHFVGWAIGEAGIAAAGDALLRNLDSDEGNLVIAAEGWARQQAVSRGWSWVEDTAEDLADHPVAVARLLLESDDLEAAWALAEADDAVDAAYWREFSPYGRGPGFALAEDASQRLLDHDRPRTALMLMNLYVGSVPIDRGLVMRGLERLAVLPADHADQFRIDSHEIERLLDYLREQPDDEERLGLLEWRLRPALRFDAHSPILERRLARDPGFFVEVLSLVYKPKDSEPEHEVPSHVAANAWRLLADWNIVPGSNEAGGDIDPDTLNQWIDDVRPLLAEANRSNVGLHTIGRVLANARSDEDGTWPTRPVRDVIDRVASPDVDDGFRIEVYNNRGVTSRGLTEGGAQERDLAERYNQLAGLVADQWPRTAAILRSIADGYTEEARRNDADAERVREGLD